MPEIKVGQKLKSAVCAAEVMIIKPGSGGSLTCGGASMLGPDETADGATADPDQMGGCLVGKRYVNEDQSLEVLCVKAGDGALALDGQVLNTKDAKKLPSSD